jgi:hypothetical protein
MTGTLLTINVPLFKKLRDIIFFCKQDGFIYKYTYILHRKDVVSKIRNNYSQK